jgi:hypothetical protein
MSGMKYQKKSTTALGRIKIMEKSTRFLVCSNLIDITSDGEKVKKRKTLFANTSASSLLRANLPTDQNLRPYIPDGTVGRKRGTIHKDIERTLLERPDDFINLSEPLTITASSAMQMPNYKTKNWDDGDPCLKLENPSLVNGAQRQGEIIRYMESQGGFSDGNVEFDPKIRVEIIVSNDKKLLTEIAIARNTSIAVPKLNKLGAGGIYDGMIKEFKDRSGVSVSACAYDKEGKNLELAVRIGFMLMPSHLSLEGNLSWKGIPSPEHSYVQKGKVIKAFASLDDNHPIKNLITEISPDVMDFYHASQAHDIWSGFNLRSPKRGQGPVKRGADNKIISVAEGLMFAFMYAFKDCVVTEDKGTWGKPRPRWTFNPNRANFTQREVSTELVKMWRDDPTIRSSVHMLARSKMFYPLLYSRLKENKKSRRRATA